MPAGAGAYKSKLALSSVIRIIKMPAGAGIWTANKHAPFSYKDNRNVCWCRRQEQSFHTTHSYKDNRNGSFIAKKL